MDARQPYRTRPFTVLAPLLLVLAAVGIGVGAGLIRLSSPNQDTTTPAIDARLRPVQIAGWSVELAIQAAWAPGTCVVLRDPAPLRLFTRGPRSVGHDTPYKTGVCSPHCQRVDVPATIPYSAEAQMDALKASVATVAGG